MIEIYTLSDSTGVRYVGQSRDAEKRFYAHLHQSLSRTTKKDAWITDCRNRGEKITMQVIDRVPENLSNIKEEYWVGHFIIYGTGEMMNTDFNFCTNCQRFRDRLKRDSIAMKVYEHRQDFILSQYDELYAAHCGATNQ